VDYLEPLSFRQLGSGRPSSLRVTIELGSCRWGVVLVCEGAVDTSSPWSSLTDTEQRIARMVSRGKTNHQIARLVSRSPHTINYYLRQIFGKFGIQSRSELAAIVARDDHLIVG
jgi:DNA-binding CsgD family transcriptional regulator